MNYQRLFEPAPTIASSQEDVLNAAMSLGYLSALLSQIDDPEKEHFNNIIQWVMATINFGSIKMREQCGNDLCIDEK